MRFAILALLVVSIIFISGCVGPTPEETVCGNGICESGETQAACCSDCGCPTGQICKDNICQFLLKEKCPENTFELKEGENEISESVILCNKTYENTSIIIIGNDIILDCNGATLKGSGSGKGIFLTGKGGVTVKNCIITNYSHGIYLESPNNIIIHNTLISNVFTGIKSWFNNNTITYNTQKNSVQGIDIIGSENIVSGNFVEGNIGNGISIYGDDNIVRNNTAINNGKVTLKAGIYIHISRNVLVDNNTVKNNYYGIKTHAGALSPCISTITNNIVCGNVEQDIYCESGDMAKNEVSIQTGSGNTADKVNCEGLTDTKPCP